MLPDDLRERLTLVIGEVSSTGADLDALVEPGDPWLPSADSDRSDVLERRVVLLRETFPGLAKHAAHLRISPVDLVETAWRVWVPYALWIADHRQAGGAGGFAHGILGGQGTGKSTLAAMVSVILSHLDLRPGTLSLDDLYLPFEEREQVKARDPRLDRRGPPGTHDVDLGLSILKDLQAGRPLQLPRFDKSAHRGAGDRSHMERVGIIDVLLFEGWFVGVEPLPDVVFDGPLPKPIETDSDRRFARDMNEALGAYAPLFNPLASLLVLRLDDYRLSKSWRLDAEHAMAAAGRPGMSDATIGDFVDYFWKALHPSLFVDAAANKVGPRRFVVDIGPSHRPIFRVNTAFTP
jgi:D-glycerate 3-kinase